MRKSFFNILYVSLIGIILVAVSCDKTEPYVDYETEEILKFMAKYEYDIEPTTTGLYYQETKAGTGELPVDLDTLEVFYSGYFLSGLRFDTNYGSEAFKFVIGNTPYLEVIAGWDEGLRFLNEGGEAIMIIPSWLAYGRQGQNTIPGYTPLFFEVELVNIIPGPNH